MNIFVGKELPFPKSSNLSKVFLFSWTYPNLNWEYLKGLNGWCLLSVGFEIYIYICIYIYIYFFFVAPQLFRVPAEITTKSSEIFLKLRTIMNWLIPNNSALKTGITLRKKKSPSRKSLWGWKPQAMFKETQVGETCMILSRYTWIKKK